jgi:hypothetical protein
MAVPSDAIGSPWPPLAIRFGQSAFMLTGSLSSLFLQSLLFMVADWYYHSSSCSNLIAIYHAWVSPFLSKGVWHGVAMDFLEFHPDPPCPTLLCPYGRFRGGMPAGHVACGCLLPLWTPHVVHLSSPLLHVSQWIDLIPSQISLLIRSQRPLLQVSSITCPNWRTCNLLTFFLDVNMPSTDHDDWFMLDVVAINCCNTVFPSPVLSHISLSSLPCAFPLPLLLGIDSIRGLWAYDL